MSIAIAVGFDGAIPDYETLLDRAATLMDRDDLADMMPVFVAYCEDDMRLQLRTLDMETTAQVIATGENVSLPADFLRLRSLYCEGSPDRPLRGMSPAALAHEFDGLSTGIPVAYAQIGRSIRLAPVPASNVLLELVYFAKFDSLSEAAPVNWILANYPTIYLSGVLAYAYDHIQDPEQAGKYANLFQGKLEALVKSSRLDRFGSGPLSPNTYRQVRGARC